jgi:hypothetical protein
MELVDFVESFGLLGVEVEEAGGAQLNQASLKFGGRTLLGVQGDPVGVAVAAPKGPLVAVLLPGSQQGGVKDRMVFVT